MLEVPLTDEQDAFARRRYQEVRERRDAAATTPAEHARRAEACVEAGTFALAFDTVRAAHDAFADAATAYLDSVEGRLADPVGTDYAAVAPHLWRGAYAALLAGDRAQARALADAAGTAERCPASGVAIDPQPYHYARAVTAAAAGDDAAVRDALAETHAGNDWAAAATGVLRGAVEGDRGAVAAGVDDLLARHRQRVDEAGRREVDAAVFSREATALTLTAWERGIEHDPDSRFVPAEFLWETLPRLS